MGSDENFEISTKKSSASPQRSHDLICLVSRTGDVVMVLILEVGVSQKVQYFLLCSPPRHLVQCVYILCFLVYFPLIFLTYNMSYLLPWH